MTTEPLTLATMVGVLAHEQDEQLKRGADVDMTIVLATGEKVTGILEAADDHLVSIRRRILDGPRPTDYTYPDIPRHYATSAVIGAYYTEGT
jgi:hypothetical protein